MHVTAEELRTPSKPGHIDTDVESVSQAIGIPLIDWTRCHILIAGRMIERKLVPAGSKLIYGHYDGPVSDTSKFAGENRIPHRWIETPDGRIVDPVRWVFTGAPDIETISVHITDCEDPAYISGSEEPRMKAALAPALPPPFSTVGAHYATSDNPALSAWISSKMQLGPNGRISLNQIHWLANRPLDRLGEMAEPFYQWLAEQRLLGCVPEKNRQMVLNPTSMTRERKRRPKM